MKPPKGLAGQLGGGGGGDCKRCGAVWVLGWNCGVGSGDGRVLKRAGRGRGSKKARGKRKANGKGNGEGKWVEWECGMCGYITKGEVVGAAVARGGLKGVGLEESSSVTTSTAQILVPTAQAPTAAVMEKMVPVSLGSKAAPLILTKIAVPAATAAVAVTPIQTVPPTPIQSGNQRAKERKKKKNNSLQEMLAAKRERESAAGNGNRGLGGMDLMDLMKLA